MIFKNLLFFVLFLTIFEFKSIYYYTYAQELATDENIINSEIIDDPIIVEPFIESEDDSVEKPTDESFASDNTNNDGFIQNEEKDSYDTTEINNEITTSLPTPIVEQSIIPPIYVVNLDRSIDRWEAISQVMSEAQLNVLRLAGVDGRKLNKLELKQNSTLLSTYLQPRGVVGCYLSHRKFWQLVVDQNYDSAIIFEDDVVLIPNFKHVLEESLTKLARDHIEYDVIFIGALG